MQPRLAVQICVHLLYRSGGESFVANILTEMSASKAGCILCEMYFLKEDPYRYLGDADYLDEVFDALSTRSAANILANMKNKDAANILANILKDCFEGRTLHVFEKVADVIAEMESAGDIAGTL